MGGEEENILIFSGFFYYIENHEITVEYKITWYKEFYDTN